MTYTSDVKSQIFSLSLSVTLCLFTFFSLCLFMAAIQMKLKPLTTALAPSLPPPFLPTHAHTQTHWCFCLQSVMCLLFPLKSLRNRLWLTNGGNVHQSVVGVAVRRQDNFKVRLKLMSDVSTFLCSVVTSNVHTNTKRLLSNHLHLPHLYSSH